MYLRTGESFVTEEVLSMPYTASSSGYLSNHVKRSFLPVPDCMLRPIYRTDKPVFLSSVRNTRPRSFSYGLLCRSTGTGQQRMTTRYVLHSNIPLSGTGEIPLKREGYHADKESTNRNR